MANIEDLRDRSVSSGTLKSDDLIPKFLGVLKTYGKDKYDKYIKENPEVEDWENLDEETMGWVVDELTDLLNEIAPDGCYFGASEGDGADFGFWSMSNESKKSEVSSLAAFDIEDVVGKKLGWTWDDDKSCLVDKDGTEVDWDESDCITIDPVEDENGNVLTQVNMWGDGTVEFQDENGESVNWTEFDDATVKKVVAVLGGKSEAKKSEKKDDYALFFETLVPGELTGARMFLTDMWNKMGNKKPRITFESEDPDFDSFVSHPTARVYVCGDTRSIASYAKYLLAHYDEIPQDFKGRWVWKNDLAYFARGFKESLEAKKSEADGNKDIFTLDLTRIDADGDEEGLDDMQAAQTFYDEDDAIKVAKELADFYKDDDGVVQVIVMAGEQEKPNGDIVGDSFDIYWASSSDKQTTTDYRKKARYAAFDTKMDYYAKGGKSEGNDDDKGCKGKDCKDDKTKKNEADATFKVGDFVSYEAGKDGKDPYDAYVYCEVIGINDDGTLDLCPFGTDANTDGIGDNANPAYCEKLDHFAGMVDAHHYYMDGKYNAYKGGWEILITDKELNPKVYEFIGTIDDLSEVIDIDDYYGGENFVFDEDLKDEVATNTGWDVETTTFADMSGDLVKASDSSEESKKTEDAGNAIQQFAGEHGKDTDKSLAKDFQAAVEAVIGDNGKVIDAWVDAPLRYTHSTAWNVSIVSDDMEADGREVCVTLYTTFDGRHYLVCDFWDKDSNIIDSVKGDYGDFDLLPMFKKCIGVSESKKSEVVSDTDPDDMKVGKFAVTLLADDDEYVGSVPGFYDDEVSAENAAKDYLKKNGSVIKSVGPVPTKIRIWTVVKDDFGSNLPKDVKVVNITADESKQSEASPDVATIEGLKSLLGRGIAVADNELRCKGVWKLNSKNPKQRQWTFVGDNGFISIKTDDDFKVIRIWGDLNKKSFDLDVSENKEESKKSESLTLKQKELKDMARFGQAEDITTISDEEAKALRKKGIETIGVSRGTYGMNGALLRDNEGKKYVITARSSNLFYFV